MFLKNKEKKMEMEKENLMKIIKEWLKNDNEIREYNKIQKEKKKRKTDIIGRINTNYENE